MIAREASSGERCGGGRIATLALEDNGPGSDRQLAQLLGDQEAMLFVADHQGRGCLQPVGAGQGFLQHRQLAGQRQELLRVGLPGDRPQAAADAPGQ